jgi:hypothetical protein
VVSPEAVHVLVELVATTGGDVLGVDHLELAPEHGEQQRGIHLQNRMRGGPPRAEASGGSR